jgi:hypothetical protein
VRATAASAAIRKRAANARDKADRDNDQASREGAKACGTKETSSCTNGNFEPFEHDRFEARKPGQPIESHFMLTRLIAQLFSIRREGKARRSRPPRSGRYPSAVGCGSLGGGDSLPNRSQRSALSSQTLEPLVL